MRLLHSLPALMLALTLAASSARGQSANNNHWRAIELSLADIGGIARVGTANPRQLNVLVDNLLKRGQFYQDLYEYERMVVRDHALLRDSIARRSGIAISAVPFFLGRGLQELGRNDAAAQAYRSVKRNAPAAVVASSDAWLATLGTTGKGWQRDLVNWRNGKPVASTSCQPAATVCNLFKAILADDAMAIVSISQDLAQNSQPDYRETIRAKNVSYAVEFYDPVALLVLSRADYALAAYALKQATGGDAARGIALLRLGRYADAEVALRAANAGDGTLNLIDISLGEVLYRTGRKVEAEQLWKGASGGNLNVLADVRGSLGAGGGALAQYQVELSKGFGRMRDGREGGVYLARALLRDGRAREAMDVLDDIRPASQGTNLGIVQPDVLVLVSRARYVVGMQPGQRDNFPLARGEIAALANDLPVARPILKLLQELTAPANIPIGPRS